MGPEVMSLHTASHRSFVNPFLARMISSTTRPSPVSVSPSKHPLIVKGWVVHFDTCGMNRRICCPGAQMIGLGVKIRSRTTLPGISVAYANPGGGTLANRAVGEGG